MEFNILINLLPRLLEWVISFFKRIRSTSVLQKAVGTEKNTKIINNITNITAINNHPIIINQARRQILNGQSRGGRK